MRILTLCLLGYWLVVTAYIHIQNGWDASPYGRPIEIAYAGGYFTYVWQVLKSRWQPLVLGGVIMPAVIGLVVYGSLRWRRPVYKGPVIPTLFLPVLVWLAWAVISDLAQPHNVDRREYGWLTLAIAVYLAIEAAKFSYYRGRKPIDVAEQAKAG